MQELTLCQHIIALIREKSLSKSFRRVKRIQLEIGEFVRINKPAILFCFNQLSRDSVAEGAKIDFIDIPASAICEVCKKIFLVKHQDEFCHHCDSKKIKILSGQELCVRNFDVE